MDADAGPLPGQEPNFELLFAPLLIGVVLNALLFGVFMVLVHSYFRLYKTDLSWIRYLIYYLILLETINTICDIALIYEPLIKMHNNPLVTVNSPKFLVADPVVTTLISTPTQLFMAWRIRLVTKKTWLAAVVALLAFTSLVGGTLASIGVAHEGTFQKFHLVSGPLTVWLTSTAFADLFITAFLCNFLWSNQTGFKTTTDSVTNKIIFFTVQTGTLTSFAAIADVTLFLIVPNTTLMFIWDFSLSKLYSICLIATLNARTEWNSLLEELPRPSGSEKGRKGSWQWGGTKDGKAKPDRDAIIKVRRATDIVGLQLYIPSNFAFSSSSQTSTTIKSPLQHQQQQKTGLMSATRRRPTHEWTLDPPQPQPLPPAIARDVGASAHANVNTHANVNPYANAGNAPSFVNMNLAYAYTNGGGGGAPSFVDLSYGKKRSKSRERNASGGDRNVNRDRNVNTHGDGDGNGNGNGRVFGHAHKDSGSKRSEAESRTAEWAMVTGR